MQIRIPWLNAIVQQKIRRGWGVAGVMRDWAEALPAPPASVRSSRILPAKGKSFPTVLEFLFLLGEVLEHDLNLDEM
jgi:hypothetical protein